MTSAGRGGSNPWSRIILDAWMTDLREVLRGSLHRPRRALSLMAVLALGFGLNAVLFGVFDTFFLRPLPFPRDEDLLILRQSHPQLGEVLLSEAGLGAVRQAKTLSGAAALENWTAVVTSAESKDEVRGVRFSRDFFSLLGIKPILGDQAPNLGRGIFISYAYWVSHYAGSSEVLGSSIIVNDEPHVVVGVVPPDLPLARPEPTLWMPVLFGVRDAAVSDLEVFARRKPSAPAAQVNNELQQIAAGLDEVYPIPGIQRRFQAYPLRQRVLGNAAIVARALQLGGIFVLFICWANGAALLLTESSSTRQATAIRIALGATRTRVAFRLLSEVGLLSCSAAVVGLLFGEAVMAELRSASALEIPLKSQLSLRPETVLPFAALFLLLTVVIVSAPTFLAAVRDSMAQLLGMKRSVRLLPNRKINVLPAFEVTLAIVLLTGTALMVQNMRSLLETKLGFDTDRLLEVTLSVSRQPVEVQRSFWRDLLDGVELVDGVQSVAAVSRSAIPFASAGSRFSFEVLENQAIRELTDDPRLDLVSPSFFRTMGIRLLGGRTFTDTDLENDLHVCVINDRLSRMAFGATDPTGRNVKVGLGSYEIVGVVDDVVDRELTQGSEPIVYVPYSQWPWESAAALIVRTANDPLEIVPAVKTLIQRTDPARSVRRIDTGANAYAREIGPAALVMAILGVFGITALALAGVGVYGAQSLIIRHRFGEIAVRIALGATASNIARVVFVRSLVPTLIGTVLGVMVSVALAGSFGSMVPESSHLSWTSYTLAALVILSVSVVACYFPMREARDVDPAQILREQE
ncbi:MAG: ABC transporter permease [Acidobacteriota bacterium]|jgi:putative ABC transport system permease protein